MPKRALFSAPPIRHRLTSTCHIHLSCQTSSAHTLRLPKQVPKFLELMYARLAFRGDAAASEALTVLRALADAGPGLASELKSAEAAYNRCRETHILFSSHISHAVLG